MCLKEGELFWIVNDCASKEAPTSSFIPIAPLAHYIPGIFQIPIFVLHFTTPNFKLIFNLLFSMYTILLILVTNQIYSQEANFAIDGTKLTDPKMLPPGKGFNNREIK